MHPNDEQLAAFLRSAVPQLDMPSMRVPREEMWTRIMAQRHGHALLGLAARDEDGVTETTVPASSLPQSAPDTVQVRARRTISVWGQGIPVRWAVPIVAGVLIVGVGLGVQVDQRRVPPQARVAAAPRLPQGLPAQIATEQHFQNVERLLTTFASFKARGEETPAVDAQVVAQARNLLSTTQLLLDSPVGMDPQRRHLLSDVELVLMQITQMAPTGPADDRDLVESSIEQSRVMERLQHATPAPKVPSGT